MKTLPELQEIITAKGLAFETLADQANWINGFRTAEKIYTKGDEMNQVAEIKKWFELAVPEPTERNFWVQAGCDAEEYGEQLRAMNCGYTAEQVEYLADEWKSNPSGYTTSNVNRKELLDALCDKVVTSIGMAHMLGMDIEGALKEVNRSNFSKFVDGKPVFNEQGKIAKPATYSQPVLDSFLGDAK